ncbi:hypothetical protein ACOMHN_059602 [Nucella lapillus]
MSEGPEDGEAAMSQRPVSTAIEAKLKMKQYDDSKAYVKPADYTIGDPVLLKTSSTACSSTPYHPTPMTQSC